MERLSLENRHLVSSDKNHVKKNYKINPETINDKVVEITWRIILSINRN